MAASSLHLVNPKAEVMKRAQALMINVNAAKGMSDVLKTNLGEQRKWIFFAIQRSRCLSDPTRT